MAKPDFFAIGDSYKDHMVVSVQWQSTIELPSSMAMQQDPKIEVDLPYIRLIF